MKSLKSNFLIKKIVFLMVSVGLFSSIDTLPQKFATELSKNWEKGYKIGGEMAIGIEPSIWDKIFLYLHKEALEGYNEGLEHISKLKCNDKNINVTENS